MKTEREIRRMVKAMEYAGRAAPIDCQTARIIWGALNWVLEEGPPELTQHLDEMRRQAEAAARHASAGTN